MDALSFLTLSTTDWDAPQFGSRQQIARELTRRGHRVLFVEVPRAAHSLISDPAGTRRAVPRMGRLRRVADGPTVFTPPPVLPFYYHPATNAVNQRLLRLYLSGALQRLSWRPDVLWTYWPNTARLVGRMGERVSVYHCIDDFTAVRYPLSSRQSIVAMEAEQCRKVDLVFARSERLATDKRQHNPETHLLAGGVDADQFDPSRGASARADVAALPRPRVGMVGTLDSRLDVGLIAQCAGALADVSFVLLGPVKRHRVDLGPIETMPNVAILPACRHSEVPAILASLDVCIIPYVMDTFTQAVSPIKLYECLAMGRPVVTTDLPYLRREEANIAIARTPLAFASAVRRALEDPPSLLERAQWRAAASAHSWAAQVDEIEGHLERVLSRRG